MTREALNKLNENQIKYCKTLSKLIETDRENKSLYQYERDCGKLKGYLDCLRDIGILSRAEIMGLFLYFYSEK